MDQNKIDSVIDAAFGSAFKNWSAKIETELYPAAFSDSYSWLRVKESIKINNSFLKEALKQALLELLSN